MPAQSQISSGDSSMSKDKRDLLDVLKGELEFVEKGGYRRCLASTIYVSGFTHLFEFQFQ
jgi:hypothetical protein